MIKDISGPTLRGQRGWLRLLQGVPVAALSALLLSTAADAITITNQAPGSTTQLPITKAVRGPNGCIMHGVDLIDRNDPNYALNSALPGGLQDKQFNACIPYSEALGLTRLSDLTSGPNNDAWFVVMGGVSVGRATSSGITLYTIGTPGDLVSGITSTNDGSIWVASSSGRLKKLSPSGQVVADYSTGFSVSHGYQRSKGSLLTAGPDGNVWMAGVAVTGSIAALLKVTPSGVVTTYSWPNVPGNSGRQLGIHSITAGPDGALWFTASPNDYVDSNVSYVGKMNMSTGLATTWTVPGETGAVTAGPDGNVWFTSVYSEQRNEVGVEVPKTFATGYFNRISSDGTLTQYQAFDFNKGVSTGSGGVFYMHVYMPTIVTGTDGKITATRIDVSPPILNYRGVYMYQTQSYTLTPDAATASNDPSITVITSGNGRGTVRTRISKAPNSSLNMATLTASPIGTSTFEGWSEQSCTGKNLTCQVTISGDKTVTANFTTTVQAQSTTHQGAILTTTDKVSVVRLRGANNGGAVLIKLIHPETSEVVGQREIDVPTGGDIQVFMDQLEPAALKEAADRPAHYTVTMEANHSFNGYFQNILWDRAYGALTNITACENPMNNVGSVGFVHSSILADVQYNSQIVITNPTDKDVAAVSLGVNDATTGSRLGTYTLNTFLRARGSKIISSAELENGSGVRPDARWLHYVVKAEGSFTGTIQHLMVNGRSGIISDLTTACPLSGVTN